MERIGSEVERTLAHTAGGTAVELARITEEWPQLVGDAIARNAWPLRLGRDGTLHVATSSATWAFELDRLAGDLSTRLVDMLGPSAPTSLRFRPGPIPEPGGGDERPDAPPRGTAEVPPEVAAEASDLAAGIDDPELREIVARAARSSLARGRSGRAF